MNFSQVFHMPICCAIFLAPSACQDQIPRLSQCPSKYCETQIWNIHKTQTQHITVHVCCHTNAVRHRSWTKGGTRSLTQLWSILCHEQQDCISSMTCHEIFTKDNFILGRLISCESSNKLWEGETEVPLGSNLVTRSDSCSEWWPFRGNSLPPFTVESWAWLS